MTWKDYFRPDWLYNYFFAKRWKGVLGDGDAIILVPYSDNQLLAKRGYYEKGLVGNHPGYTTADGDIYVAEGAVGDPVMYLFGLPVVLALNPSEHAAVIDPLKSLIAHKRDIGEFVRVDKEGQVLEVGPAVKPADEGGPVDIGEAEVADAAADGGAVPTASENPTHINYEVEDALFDLTPTKIVDPETGDVVDQADGFVISQRKAADLIPSKTSSQEIKLMQQRERNAMADASERIKTLLIGAALASIMWLVFVVILLLATGNAPGVV